MNYYQYFSEIEETFVRRRGRNLLLSPLDWALIESWKERGIPLRLVLASIHSVFDAIENSPGRQPTVKSLSYCSDEVESRFAEWIDGRAGSHGLKAQQDTRPSDETVAKHLDSIARDLEDAIGTAPIEVAKHLSESVARLKNLGETVPADVETLLEEIDRSIDAIPLERCAEESICEQVKSELSAIGRNPETAENKNAYDRMVLHKIREQTKIPRASLFYL